MNFIGVADCMDDNAKFKCQGENITRYKTRKTSSSYPIIMKLQDNPPYGSPVGNGAAAAAVKIL